VAAALQAAQAHGRAAGLIGELDSLGACWQQSNLDFVYSKKMAGQDVVSAGADLQSKIAEARNRLDAWVREVVAWHFDTETGTPFWLEYAKQLDWDPRREIRGYEDLARFGYFQDEWLRGGPVRRWVPKAYADRPIYTFETGGSTGVPKSRISIEDFRIDYEMFSDTLSDEHFPKGSDWLMLGPSGPRRLRLAVEHLAQYRGGICFMVDLDPRWVIKLIKMNQMEMAEKYKQHVIDQGLTLLKAHEGIQCLFTTPKLLEALCEKISLKRAGIKGVFCGGTEMTPQFHRFAVEELLDGVYFAPTYGNTLMGLAVHKPRVPEDNYAIIYYPPAPRAMIEVVDPDDPDRLVDYGETGRVRLTTLTKEFFMPRFLERDEAEREKPFDLYPWDGVRNVRPFSRFQATVVEGVY
jgi:phenylacetate-coenzyme A ligase PaaK-like adenylate-forming protein